MKPKKQCNHAGCKILIEYDQKYCNKHQYLEKKSSDYDTYAKRKHTGGKYFYFYKSKSWANASRLYRLNNPCCEACLKDGIVKKADVVDHIIEIKDDWSKRLDESNFQSLCHRHHNQKTWREKRKRATPP